MHIPTHIRSFWFECLSEANREPDTPIYDVFHFDDNKSDANELAALVLQGRKLATASLLWEYGTDGKRQPQAGDLSVVTDWDGSPLCVIETSEVEVRAYKDVDEDSQLPREKAIYHWSIGKTPIGRILGVFVEN